jgi:hypothetical protein
MERQDLESLSIDRKIIIKVIIKEECVGEWAEGGSGLG